MNNSRKNISLLTKKLDKSLKCDKNNSLIKQDLKEKCICQLCELDFKTIQRLNFHLTKIHFIDKRISFVQCYVDDCEEKFKNRIQLVDHLNQFHNLDVNLIKYAFETLDDFYEWKNDIEKETGYTWIQNNKYYLKGLLRKTFICNRSTTKGSKIYSLHGLTTINKNSTLCLSSIKLVENQNGSFDAEFIDTHNHDE